MTKERGSIGSTRFQRKAEEGGIDSTNGQKKVPLLNIVAVSKEELKMGADGCVSQLDGVILSQCMCISNHHVV